jgi:lipid A ethanolaminephosphotransferase
MLRVETLVLIVVAYLIAALNGAWWQAVTADRAWSDPGSWLFVAACFVALVALHFALLAPFANRWIAKPLLTALVIASAAAAYFMRNYSILLDPTMIQNVLHTDAREAAELLTFGALLSVVAWVAIPVAFIWLVRIERRTLGRAVLLRVASVLVALVAAVLALLPISRDFTSLMRNHREARYLVTPGNFIYGLAAQSLRHVDDAKRPREPVGTDAHRMVLAAHRAPRVFVLVVGETARAANFSLLGYPRETNPELAKLDVIAFSDVTACGTSTEVSVPCLFSHHGREHYDESRIRHSENLLDVLVRAGYRVKWLDNQSGCKGVCQGAGVEYEKLDPAQWPDDCDGNECQDGALVSALERELQAVRSDTVFVLHMMGNHGPAYFKRYPRTFRRFLPDCATAQLRDCGREAVVNAYDNAILYTDHVLASLVRLLRAAGPRDAAMLYVSDHGESLGEKGLYLHGMPYAIAPAQQTQVPMIVWLSPLAARESVSTACLRQKAHARLSHDHVFHSVLGLLDVRTAVYRPERDLFDGCKGGTYRVMIDQGRNHARP